VSPAHLNAENSAALRAWQGEAMQLAQLIYSLRPFVSPPSTDLQAESHKSRNKRTFLA
jgi:hypothetical protein